MCTSLSSEVETRVGESVRRFIPYVQMYEFEGLLFSSPEAIGTVLHDQNVTDWAQGVLDQFNNNPEEINDAPQTAPSKRIIQKTNYRKTTHGPNIAKEIGLPTMREMCLGFSEWLTKIEALAN